MKKETPNTLLNAWGSDISKLLKLVETCTHNIEKEMMMHVANKKKNALA